METLPDLKKWFDLTEQQTRIIKIISLLNNLNIDASPNKINEKYKELFGKKIDKPNLFRQLKILVNESLIHKNEKFAYILDFEGISRLLSRKEEQIKKEIQNFNEFKMNLMGRLKSLAESETPRVKYLPTTKDYFDEVVRYLIDADVIYIVSPFANITFTSIVSESASRKEYNEILHKRCFFDKTLRVKYLTKLNLVIPYTHAYKKYKDKNASLRECKIIVDNLINMLKTHPLLSMHYLDNPFGFDFLLPVKNNDPKHIFLYIRNKDNIITSGLYIKSSQIAKKAEEHFLNECKIALNLKSKKGYAKIRRLYSHLKRKKFLNK